MTTCGEGFIGKDTENQTIDVRFSGGEGVQGKFKRHQQDSMFDFVQLRERRDAGPQLAKRVCQFNSYGHRTLMLKLDRYIASELLQSIFAALIILTMVMVGGAFMDVLKDVTKGTMPAGMMLAQLGLVMLTSLPSI